jgi:hypothetical protein
LPPSVSRLSRQCGILNISKPYRLPRPVTGIALLFYFSSSSGGGGGGNSSFLILYIIGRVLWTGGGGISLSQGRDLHTGQHKHKINTHLYASNVIRTHNPSVRQQPKTVHASDRVATVIGILEQVVIIAPRLAQNNNFTAMTFFCHSRDTLSIMVSSCSSSIQRNQAYEV